VFCWIDRNKFCATCGHANNLSDSGFKLSCSNTNSCKSHSKLANKYVPSNIHYPRVDPVAIMLVVSRTNNHILLGRKKAFPPKMYSCLAGYVEAGESLEEAVRRETYEEAGIHCDRIEYHSSQPWPFPSTLMLGCIAYAKTEEVKVDGNELEEARWFSKEEVELICKGEHPNGYFIPTERAIANRLIHHWNKNNVMGVSKL
jgi:NAD+ diphosphatase